MSKESNSLVEKILRKPHIILAFLALLVLTGITGYDKMHRNLFPNSNYPEVALVIVQPGASAKTMASNIAVPVEEESSGTPVWLWIILGLVVIAIVALGIKMFGGGDSTNDGTTPPPAAPPATGGDTPPAADGGDAPTTDTPPTTDSN